MAESKKEDVKKGYFVNKGKCIRFKAGMKVAGDEVDPKWPEYVANKDLLAEHVKKGLVVQVK